jgi:hypothetical protein
VVRFANRQLQLGVCVLCVKAKDTTNDWSSMDVATTYKYIGSCLGFSAIFYEHVQLPENEESI